jgi:biotin carboxyl carrier protein
MTQRERFRAQVGDHTFELTVAGDQLSVEGTDQQVSLVRSGGSSWSLILNGRSYRIVLEEQDDASLVVSVDGKAYPVHLKDERALLLERFGLAEGASVHREVNAPMPGLVLRVLVEEGQEVAAGDGLIVLEAMKMENELRAPADGRVATIHVTAGMAVVKNALLIEFDS